MYKTGRPSQWKGKTTVIRVPEAYADRLVALARWWDQGGGEYAPDIFTREAQDATREHLNRYNREALIDEILAFRTDQDALWARICKNP